MVKYKKFNESVLSKLMDDHSSEFYEYLGKPNSAIWTENLSRIISTKEIIPITNTKIDEISKLLDVKQLAQYPILKAAVNCRFGTCWFLNTYDIGFFGHYYYDICVGVFEDEWYLVNIGNGGGYSYWYMCDQFEGLKKLIQDKFN